MFRELVDLVKDRPLTLTVVGLAENRLRVCVIPQSLESDDKVNAKAGNHKEVAKIPDVAIKALTTPLCLEGTAEELDAEMPEKLTRFTEAHRALRGSLETAQDQISQAVKAIEERDRQKVKDKQSSKKDAAAGNKPANEKSGGQASEQSPSLPLDWCAAEANTSSTPTAGEKTGAQDGPQGKEEQC